MTETKPHLEVAAALIVHRGSVLACRRSTGPLAGGWEFPGGKIEPGETAEQAVVREVAEELGATFELDADFGMVRYEYDDFTMELHCFIGHLLEPTFELREHSECRWLDADNVWDVPWLGADVEVVRAMISARTLGSAEHPVNY